VICYAKLPVIPTEISMSRHDFEQSERVPKDALDRTWIVVMEVEMGVFKRKFDRKIRS